MGKLTVSILMFAGMSLAVMGSTENVCFDVQGMTCGACSLTLKTAVKKLKGIQEVDASVEKNHALVRFDGNETNTTAIKNAIDNVGYRATPKECKDLVP